MVRVTSPDIRRQAGSLSLPLCLALALILFVGFGAWGLLRDWNSLAATQLRLDRCAGRAAQELRATMNMIESSNRQIEALRAAILASILAPQAIPALRAAAQAIAAAQDLALLHWRLRQGSWLLSGSCGALSRDLPKPLPSLDWRRPPPDPVGPRPLFWLGGEPGCFHIQISHRPRASAASVERKGAGTNGKKWMARWAQPVRSRQ